MKRFLCLVLALCLLLCGCGNFLPGFGESTTETTEFVPAPIAHAPTKDPNDPEKYPDGVPPTTVPALDVSQHLGAWYPELYNRFDGSVLELDVNGENLLVSYTHVNGVGNRVAEFQKSLDISGQTGTEISFPFVDSWNNTGTMLLSFAEQGAVTMVVQNVQADPEARFGIAPGNWRMVPGVPPVEMDEETQFEINIFLSNFAEQRIVGGWGIMEDMPFHVEDKDYAAMAEFAITYMQINTPGRVHHVANDPAYGDNMGAVWCSLADVKKEIQRFFGLEATELDLVKAGLDVRNGRVYKAEEPSPNIGRLAVVEKFYDNGDGTFTASFGVWQVLGMPERAMYEMTIDEITMLPDAQWVEQCIAVVRPYRYNDRNSYQLIAYRVE